MSATEKDRPEKYRLEKCENSSEWDRFVDSSPQGSIFCRSLFLDAVDQPYSRFKVLKGDKWVAAVALSTVSREASRKPLESFFGHGIFFAPSEKEKGAYRVQNDEFQITEFVIEQLSQDFPRLRFSLSPQFSDLRPIQWLNYHSQNERDKFKIKINYLSELEATSEKSTSSQRVSTIREIAQPCEAPPFFQNLKSQMYHLENESGELRSFVLDSNKAYLVFASSENSVFDRDCIAKLGEKGISRVDWIWSQAKSQSPEHPFFFEGTLKAFYEVSLDRDLNRS